MGTEAATGRIEGGRNLDGGKALVAWQNRIVGQGVKRADQFEANPNNWRTHPQSQRDALRGSLNEVGWVQQVIENVRTGHLVDGHERVWSALQNDNAEVPFIQVDLSEDEEAYVLATLDPIGEMATTDAKQLDALLHEVQSGDAGIQALLAEIAERAGVVPASDDDWASAFDSLPDGERAPFQQMTFTLHDSQVETVKVALDRAKHAGAFGDTGNENSNGNALARVCEAYIGRG